MKKFFQEFKQFIARGNVMDMAVGVIVGGAFNGIVTSLIDDILSPILGMLPGGGTTLAASLTLGLPSGGELMVGNFINAALNFLVMALVVFCLVKAINSLHRKKKEAPPPPPQPSNEEKLLTEIRDLLKENRNG